MLNYLPNCNVSHDSFENQNHNIRKIIDMKSSAAPELVCGAPWGVSGSMATSFLMSSAEDSCCFLSWTSSGWVSRINWRRSSGPTLRDQHDQIVSSESIWSKPWLRKVMWSSRWASRFGLFSHLPKRQQSSTERLQHKLLTQAKHSMNVDWF